jgi:glucose-1-phosphate adenylyltransferase
VNSGIRRIGICTQYRARSLIRHVQRGWSFLEGRFGEFVELMPAQQQSDTAQWYQGTADAVYQNLDLLTRYAPKHVVVLAGDHVYKMDYSKMLEEHVAMDVKMSVASIDVPVEDATQLGVIAVDDKGCICGFVEKPAHPPTIPGRTDRSLGSMGVYAFDAEFLYDELVKDARDPNSSHDFGKDIIPRLVREKAPSYAHNFASSCVNMTEGVPYWRDVGTIDAYWEANIDLTRVVPGPEPLRPGLADLDLPGAAPAGEVRLQHRGAPRRGRGLAGLRRLHRERLAREPLAPLHQRPRPQLLQHRGLGDPPRRGDRPQLRHPPRGDRQPLQPAARASPWASIPRPTASAFHVTDKGVTLVVPEMLGQQIHHLR